MPRGAKQGSQHKGDRPEYRQHDDIATPTAKKRLFHLESCKNLSLALPWHPTAGWSHLLHFLREVIHMEFSLIRGNGLGPCPAGTS